MSVQTFLGRAPERKQSTSALEFERKMDKRHLKDEKEVLSHDASRSQESRQEEAMAKSIEKSKKNLS